MVLLCEGRAAGTPVPGDLGYYDPVCAYWQWTIDANGNKKVNNWGETSITSITKEHDGSLHLGFDFDNIYFYTVTVAEDANTVELTMRDKDGTPPNPRSSAKALRDQQRFLAVRSMSAGSRTDIMQITRC